MTKLSELEPYSLIVEGFQHHSSAPSEAPILDTKARLEGHHPTHTFEVRDYMVCIEEVDTMANKVTRWRKGEGYSLWCKPPLH